MSRAHVWRALRAVRMAGSSSRCVASSSSRAPVKKQRLTVRKEPARGELFEPRLPRGSAGRAYLEKLSEAAPTVKCEPSSPGLVPGLRRYTCKQEASSSSSLARRPLPRADKAAVGHFLPGPVMLAMPWPRLAPKAEAEASEAEAEAEAAEAAEAEAVDVADFADESELTDELSEYQDEFTLTAALTDFADEVDKTAEPEAAEFACLARKAQAQALSITPPERRRRRARRSPRRGALRGRSPRGARSPRRRSPPGGGGGPGALRRQASRAEARTEARTEAGSAGALHRRQASRAAATADSEPRAGPSACGHPAHRQRPRRVTGMMMPHLPSLASPPA